MRSFVILAESITKLVTLFLQVGTSNIYSVRIRVSKKETSLSSLQLRFALAGGPGRSPPLNSVRVMSDSEKAMATHSSVLAWRIPGTAEPGGLPSLGSHRIGHN